MHIEAEIAGVRIGDRHPVGIMGVINLSPESFYSGSVVQEVKPTLKLAVEMVNQGCNFLDIGGRSTAPGVEKISITTEKERVLPVLKVLLDEISIPISVDTQYAEVAEEALKLGCHIINDVSGLQTDPKLIDVVKDYDSSLILMATEKVPGDRLKMNDIISALKNSMEIASSKGLDLKKIIIDPGVGKWVPSKIHKYDLQIINQLQLLRELGRPILVGISRKSFIGTLLQKSDPQDRLYGSLAATAIAIYNGAHIIRTHDPSDTIDVIRIAEALRNNIYEEI